MNRFFVDKANINACMVKIVEPQEVRHLAKVLRVREKEELFITDGEGRAYVAEVERILKNEVILKIKQVLKERDRCGQKVLVTLACAVPQHAKFEEIIDKATQLGVDEIIPLLTERTLVKKEIFKKKKARYNRILMAAAKQSGILFLPIIKEAVFFHELLQMLRGYDLILIPNLAKKSVSLKEALADFKGGRLLVLIGPEGDFTPEEVDFVFSCGGKGVSLGESVLRVDTAAIAVLSYLRLFFEL